MTIEIQPSLPALPEGFEFSDKLPKRELGSLYGFYLGKIKEIDKFFMAYSLGGNTLYIPIVANFDDASVAFNYRDYREKKSVRSQIKMTKFNRSNGFNTDTPFLDVFETGFNTSVIKNNHRLLFSGGGGPNEYHYTLILTDFFKSGDDYGEELKKALEPFGVTLWFLKNQEFTNPLSL